MSEFNGVTVVRKANVYFDGKVTSRTLRFSDDTEKTLGFMQPGEYVFNTADKEIMEILSGNVTVTLEGSDQSKNYSSGEVFEVPANSSFTIKSNGLTDYCCSFVK